jgi:putative sigma-54 modulation protein
MRLELTGRHVDITAGVRRVVDSKLAKLERLLNDSAVSAQVVLSLEKGGRRADITLHARGEKFLHGTGRGISMPVAITDAVDKLAQQAQKVKGQWQTQKRRAARSGGAAPEAAPTETPATPKGRPRRPRMLKGTRQTITAMSIGEASALVDAETAVVIFRDAETGQLAVVYRALSGDLTLIHTRE